MLRPMILSAGLALFALTVYAQGTVGPGELPKTTPRINWTDKTKGIIVEINPDIFTMKVKDEITNKTTTYRIIKNAKIEGDKKLFDGRSGLTVKDLQKGQRIQIVYYQGSPEVAREVKVLKPKNN